MAYHQKYENSKMLIIAPDCRANRDIPNLAAGYAAAVYSARVIDFNTNPRNLKRILNYKTEILAFSIQSRAYTSARQIAVLYQKKYSDVLIKSINGFLDIQCCYEFVDFADKIEYSEKFSDNYPFPAYENFDTFDIYLKNWQRGSWSYPLMTSLGCPYSCIYCNSRNRKPLMRTIENCYSELENAKKKWNIKKFLILDDCFNFDEKRVLQFCEAIKKLGLKWSCANGLRADRFNENVAIALAEAGCEHLGFGVETIDDEILKQIKKGETLEQIENAVKIAKKYFNNVHCFFIIGLPGSTFEKDLAALEWSKKFGISAHFSYYVPFNSEKELYDKIFYGCDAEPLSDAYSKELQKKIYEITEDMRPEVSFNMLKKIKKYILKKIIC